jgi:hypothetical protein
MAVTSWSDDGLRKVRSICSRQMLMRICRRLFDRSRFIGARGRLDRHSLNLTRMGTEDDLSLPAGSYVPQIRFLQRSQLPVAIVSGRRTASRFCRSALSANLASIHLMLDSNLGAYQYCRGTDERQSHRQPHHPATAGDKCFVDSPAPARVNGLCRRQLAPFGLDLCPNRRRMVKTFQSPVQSTLKDPGE